MSDELVISVGFCTGPVCAPIVNARSANQISEGLSYYVRGGVGNFVEEHIEKQS